MKKYICDICGFVLELDENLSGTQYTKCSICGGKLISEETMKEKEEMAKMIDEDKGDDDYSPEQDATEEAIDLIIIEGMTRNMKELGNDSLYKHIEDLSEARQRARYRKYFLLVGGQVPQGEPIIIKEK